MSEGHTFVFADKQSAMSAAIAVFDSHKNPTMRHTGHYPKYAGCYVVLPYEGGSHDDRIFFTYKETEMKKENKQLLMSCLILPLIIRGFKALGGKIKQKWLERKAKKEREKRRG
ncbi:MAG: hypothetical protein ACYTFK_14245, partial [Planctomycetota bacterium]|jgi:hypothetical protein